MQSDLALRQALTNAGEGSTALEQNGSRFAPPMMDVVARLPVMLQLLKVNRSLET
jgi:hypothetical protein